jgi:4-amino-4-deoxy-L-arabinose transferase-like glycosyltransferase
MSGEAKRQQMSARHYRYKAAQAHGERVATPLGLLWRKLPRPARAAAVALLRGLARSPTSNRCLLILLLGYLVVWTISAEIRNFGVPLTSDMLEAFALSREWAIGYIKHPPLLNWVIAAWFAIMPIASWSFYLLAMLNVALALWLVWLAAGFVTDQRRRIMTVALLCLTPIFTFHAANFNHNAISLSLWPLVVLSFFASVARPQLIWSILFGAASGLAMLGKYYAGLIVLACVLAAFLHPNRSTYLRSPRPWLAAATCGIVLAPNLYWLIENHFISITYHVALERSIGLTAVLLNTLSSVAAYVAYLLLAFVILWFCLRPWTAVMVRSVVGDWPATRKIIGCIAFLPGVLPILLMPLTGIAVHSPWTFPAYFFVPLAIVSAPRLPVTFRATAATLGAAALFAALVLVASPLLMVVNFMIAKPDRAAPYAALSHSVTDLWRKRTGRRLEFVTGTTYRAWYVTFYSRDHPTYVPNPSHIMPPAEVEESWNEGGVAAICGLADKWCEELFKRALPGAERAEITLPNTFLGLRRAPQTYVIYLQPGRR